MSIEHCQYLCHQNSIKFEHTDAYVTTVTLSWRVARQGVITPLPIYYRGNMSSKLASISKADASEEPETFENMMTRYLKWQVMKCNSMDVFRSNLPQGKS